MVAIVAHAGNWEYTVMGYGLKYGPVAVVGRELDHPRARGWPGISGSGPATAWSPSSGA